MKLKIILLMLVSQIVSISLLAQSNQQVKDVFDLYGKQKGAVMVQLSTDILASKSRITLYKSLVVNNDEDVRQSVSEILGNENLILKEISVVRKNGKTVNGVYLMSESTTGKSKVYEYLLYNLSSKLTFVYLRGDFPPDDLDNELKKLKDLFIYLNKSK